MRRTLATGLILGLLIGDAAYGQTKPCGLFTLPKAAISVEQHANVFYKHVLRELGQGYEISAFGETSAGIVSSVYLHTDSFYISIEEELRGLDSLALMHHPGMINFSIEVEADSGEQGKIWVEYDPKNTRHHPTDSTVLIPSSCKLAFAAT